MELKMKYHYTYFIHPFVIKEDKYQKFLLKIIKDERFNLKTFEKGKDLTLYQHFTPKVSEFLFSSFSHSEEKKRRLNDLSDETKVALLSQYPCIIFECNLKKDIQGKAQEKGIFFKIQKVELICFKTGICFLSMKTNVENSEDFSDLLNFNYKFRDINRIDEQLSTYDKIFLQTDSLDDINSLPQFIKDITGTNLENFKLNIDTERFLVYSYACIDQQAWGEEKDFTNVQDLFNKYANFLPADNTIDYEEIKGNVLSKWKNARMGINKQGVSLFTSTADINNYTILPEMFEREYFYTYILNLYKKIYLKKLEQEFKNVESITKSRKKFVDFTRNLWIQDVTEDELGAELDNKIIEVFEIKKWYFDLKTEYDVLYKESNIEKNTQMTKIIICVLLLTLIVNLITYVALIK